MSQAEEATALLAAIVQGTDDAIFSKTLDAIVTSWNPAAERIYGYTAEEIIGASVSVLVPNDLANEIPQIMQKIRAGESIDHFETVRKHKSGRLIYVSVTISPIRDRRGEIVGASTIARDITNRRLSEEALRGSEKLAAMGRMAASIAHEMRNPLDVAKNIAYLLMKNESLDPQAREMVNLLDNQLTHVVEICTRTLAFARPGDTATRVAISGIAEEVLALLRRNLVGKAITAECRFESRGEVIGYPGPMRQLFVNLIGNAIDAIAPGTAGKILVRIRDARHPLTGVEGVRITVSDTGSGIDPAHLSSLFQPFFSTKKETGTGLGLWVTSGIVAQHGGTIGVRSRIAGRTHGTLFSVFLPKLGTRENGKTQAA